MSTFQELDFNPHKNSEQTQLFKQLAALPTRKSERWKFTPIAGWLKNSAAQTTSEQLSLTCHDKELKFEQLDSAQPIGQILGLIKKYQLATDEVLNYHLSQVSLARHIVVDQDHSLVHLKGQQNAHHMTVLEFTGNHITFIDETSAGFHTVLIINKGKMNSYLPITSGNDQTNAKWVFVEQGCADDEFLLQQTHVGGHNGFYAPYIFLTERKSTVHNNSLVILKAKEHFDIHSFTKHSAPETFSNQVAKTLLFDDAVSVFAGKIEIDEHCNLVAADQFNKNLILSDKAQAYSEPQLEIYNDDVKCSHGSTTAQFSQDEIFYLMSRGISRKNAKNLILNATVTETLDSIANSKAKTYLQQKVQEGLNVTL